jgi:type II secretory pathway pseudopilin PulG
MNRHKLTAFTLIELITVITIIIILAALVLSVAGYAQRKGASSRAQSEIAAMGAACESYKADNGIYPNDGSSSTGSYVKGATDTLNARGNNNPTQAVYLSAGLVLYRALSGDTNCDGNVNVTDETYNISGTSQPSTGVLPTVYYPFKSTQIITTSGTVSQLADPFGYSYGYSTAYQGQINATGTSSSTMGFNPTYDLWSTLGTTTGSGTSGVWMTNW